MLSFLLLFWIILVTTFFTIIISLILFIEPLFGKRSFIPHYLIRIWGKSTLLFHEVQVVGKHHLLKDQAQIIFANHLSNIDILLFSTILDIPFTWMSKDSLFRIPLFGWMLKKLGYIPIAREHSILASRALIKGIRKLKENVSIIIFPEGTVSDHPDKMLPFKEGFHLLAKRSHVPILPIKIIGTYHVNPPDTLKVHLGKLKLVIHPPIYPKDYLTKKKEDFLLDMRAILENNP